MSLPPPLVLVDEDVRRRATITHELAEAGYHVEPFESPGELLPRWPERALLIVHDGEGALEAVLEHMKTEASWLPVIGFAERPAIGQVVAAMRDGAIDYLAWPLSGAELGDAIERAVDQARSLGSARAREAFARRKLDKLTRREREVLVGVAAGLSNRRIAERLAISPRTVEIHRANMLTKIGAHHTSEAIRIAIEAALV
ncbi:MAG: LuxR family transcriptional regulator [Novosphingobium sp.]|nr:LuxR family transcriptional regulator [Novosphingobium sp.]